MVTKISEMDEFVNGLVSEAEETGASGKVLHSSNVQSKEKYIRVILLYSWLNKNKPKEPLPFHIFKNIHRKKLDFG